MKWNKEDMDKYITAKEYVDTLILPLVPFNLSNDQKIVDQAFQNEVISIFSREIERVLTGRVLLTPNYYYSPIEDKEKEVERINSLVEDAKEQPFTHVMFLTFDLGWKKREELLNGNLIWLPAIQSGDLQSTEVRSLIRDQVNQVAEMIRSYW